MSAGIYVIRKTCLLIARGVAWVVMICTTLTAPPRNWKRTFAKGLATALETIGLSTKAIIRKRWKEYFTKVRKGKYVKMEELGK